MSVIEKRPAYTIVCGECHQQHEHAEGCSVTKQPTALEAAKARVDVAIGTDLRTRVEIKQAIDAAVQEAERAAVRGAVEGGKSFIKHAKFEAFNNGLEKAAQMAQAPAVIDGSPGNKFDDTVDAWADGYIRGREDAADAVRALKEKVDDVA